MHGVPGERAGNVVVLLKIIERQPPARGQLTGNDGLSKSVQYPQVQGRNCRFTIG